MKKRIAAVVLAMGMAVSTPVFAAEITEERVAALEERVAALEERIALLEALLGAAAETEETADGMEIFEESYTLTIGIGTVMRETPDEKGKVMNKLRVGNEVTVLGGSEEWLQVEYNEEVGYVNRALVEAQ